jgi:hypothetical protein
MEQLSAELNEYSELKSISDDFAQTASKVNTSSLERRDHTKKAIISIEEAEHAGGLLLNELNAGSRESILMRNRHDAVLNICRILQINIEKQFKLLARIENEQKVSPSFIDPKKLQRIRELNSKMLTSLSKATPLLERIVKLSNEMILIDNVIKTSKKHHKKEWNSFVNLREPR